MAPAPSSVLLLDEPTSALEPATEAALIGDLLAARGDACIDELRPRCAEFSHFLRLPSPGPPA